MGDVAAGESCLLLSFLVSLIVSPVLCLKTLDRIIFPSFLSELDYLSCIFLGFISFSYFSAIPCFSSMDIGSSSMASDNRNINRNHLLLNSALHRFQLLPEVSAFPANGKRLVMPATLVLGLCGRWISLQVKYQFHSLILLRVHLARCERILCTWREERGEAEDDGSRFASCQDPAWGQLYFNKSLVSAFISSCFAPFLWPPSPPSDCAISTWHAALHRPLGGMVQTGNAWIFLWNYRPECL